MGGLSGKVAGVQISSAGNTGTSQKVLIRGISSFSGNTSPLVLVDGVERSLNDIDPAENRIVLGIERCVGQRHVWCAWCQRCYFD